MRAILILAAVFSALIVSADHKKNGSKSLFSKGISYISTPRLAFAHSPSVDGVLFLGKTETVHQYVGELLKDTMQCNGSRMYLNRNLVAYAGTNKASEVDKTIIKSTAKEICS